MCLKSILCFMILYIAAGCNAQAKDAKKNKPYFRLIEAYSQRTVPGVPGAPIKTQYHFIIIWEGRKYPETFFWRGDSGWLPCSMLKAHRVANIKHNTRFLPDYTTDFTNAGTIHKRDTLELTPIAGGKFPIPAEIPANAKNTLYYKTGGSGWLAFPVKNMTRKPDIVMP